MPYMPRSKIITRSMERKEARANEARVCQVRVLQSRGSNGSVQACSSPKSNRWKRIHLLLRKMRATLPTDKEVAHKPTISRFFYALFFPCNARERVQERFLAVYVMGATSCDVYSLSVPGFL